MSDCEIVIKAKPIPTYYNRSRIGASQQQWMGQFSALMPLPHDDASDVALPERENARAPEVKKPVFARNDR